MARTARNAPNVVNHLNLIPKRLKFLKANDQILILTQTPTSVKPKRVIQIADLQRRRKRVPCVHRHVSPSQKQSHTRHRPTNRRHESSLSLSLSLSLYNKQRIIISDPD